tara:strand:+ start:20663 stop:21205 length:543 start_codon:yes stop_codon:yes gene_type:complete
MENEEFEKLRYPIGPMLLPDIITEDHISEWILVLEEFPQRLEALVGELSAFQLDTPYRPEGWTVRQVVHHIADSHHHSYTRFKWALAEQRPLIKAYGEKEWADLFDAHTAPVRLSLDYIAALHAKMVYMLKGLAPSDLEREYIHPDGNKAISVAANIGRYAWHSNHHYAHIANLVQREGW